MSTNDDRPADSTGSPIDERPKDVAPGPQFGSPSAADEIGEAAGGISGALMGAGIGSTAGPMGTLIGGMAGAVGGWWAGRAVSEVAERLSDGDAEPRAESVDQLQRPDDIRE